MKIVGAIFLAALLAGFGWRELKHQSSVAPAIVTPQTNLHLALGDDLVARMYRAASEAGAGDRSGRPKLIALTFDDGPYPIFTPMLLDVLSDLHVPATFFLIGRDAQQWPELTRRIVAGGNEVANHTYTHPNLDQESAAQVRAELLEGRDALWKLTHDSAVRSYMRPPHGRYTAATLRVVQSLGYTAVLWTDDGGDWRTLTPQEIVEQVTGHATAPDLVLLHSGKLATIQALPEIVERFREAGYRFVTVGELLSTVSPAELDHPLAKRV